MIKYAPPNSLTTKMQMTVMNVCDNLAVECCAFLVLLLKMVTKELARAGWRGCGCIPARAWDAGGTGCAFAFLPPCILRKGISHPGAGAGLRSWLLSPRKSLVLQQCKTSLILAPICFGRSWLCPKTAGSAGLGGVLLGAHVPCAEQIVDV